MHTPIFLTFCRCNTHFYRLFTHKILFYDMKPKAELLYLYSFIIILFCGKLFRILIVYIKNGKMYTTVLSGGPPNTRAVNKKGVK